MGDFGFFDLMGDLGETGCLASKHGCGGFGILLSILILIGLPFYFYEEYQVKKEKDTKVLVVKIAKEMDINTLHTTKTDSWGNKFRIVKEKKLLRYNLTVTSAGRDEVFDTSDDIAVTKWRR